VRGEVNIEEVNDALGVEIPEGEEFETIAGFIFNRAGRLVEEGEEITYEDVRIRVEEVENTRILKARLSRTADRETAAETDAEVAADGDTVERDAAGANDDGPDGAVETEETTPD
ncbi:MAG: transporter associated domain-containing protein, partial [Halobacteriales archaeon]